MHLVHPYAILLEDKHQHQSWEDKVCYSCTNNYQTITADNIYISNCNGTISEYVQKTAPETFVKRHKCISSKNKEFLKVP